MPLIGAHMSIAGGLDLAFARAEALGCESMQIFTRNQRQWLTKPLTDQEIEKFRSAYRKSSVRSVVSHASYLINLSGEPEIRAKSERLLTAEVERCHQLGIDGIVLHPGFAVQQTKSDALRMISELLLRVFERTDETRVKILLETMAGQGTSIGGDLSDFSVILELTEEHDRVAFCADTCHMFAAGYEMRTQESYNRLISMFEKHMTLERLLCWHLNDSKAERGANLDRHAHLGQGEIGLTPFALLMEDRRFDKIPAILETPNNDKNGADYAPNIAILRKFRGL